MNNMNFFQIQSNELLMNIKNKLLKKNFEVVKCVHYEQNLIHLYVQMTMKMN